MNLNVCLPYVYSWHSQEQQYPATGLPGINYFKGELPDGKWVDCLLYRDDEGVLVGILNHYPFCFPGLEEKGNVNIWIKPSRQRQGIGTALVTEAIRRYKINFEQQRYTEAGAQLAKKFVK
jgi:GNAT superfamily N-acetyltransferase